MISIILFQILTFFFSNGESSGESNIEDGQLERCPQNDENASQNASKSIKEMPDNEWV